MPAKARKKAGKSGGVGRVFRVLISTPFRQIILTVLILAILFWQWPNIEAAGIAVANVLGWGIVIIVACIAVLALRIRQRKYSSFLYRWNRWLAGFVFAMVVWGTLAFFDLGGEFGLAIIGDTDIIGVLQLLGLAIIGIILMVPSVSFRLIARFFFWLSELFKKKQATRTAGKEPGPAHLPLEVEQSRPRERASVETPEPEEETPPPRPGAKATAPETTPPPPPKGRPTGPLTAW